MDAILAGIRRKRFNGGKFNMTASILGALYSVPDTSVYSSMYSQMHFLHIRLLLLHLVVLSTPGSKEYLSFLGKEIEFTRM